MEAKLGPKVLHGLLDCVFLFCFAHLLSFLNLYLMFIVKFLELCLKNLLYIGFQALLKQSMHVVEKFYFPLVVGMDDLIDPWRWWWQAAC